MFTSKHFYCTPIIGKRAGKAQAAPSENEFGHGAFFPMGSISKALQ
jgi:hypothetical protein